MIFEINSSIRNINRSNSNQLSALEHLIQSHRNGQHILIIKPIDIFFLIENISSELSAPTRICLTHLLNNTSTLASVKSLVTEHAVVYIPEKTGERISKNGNIWNIPIEYFSKSAIIASSVLGEDPIDAQIYIELASKLLMQKIESGFHIEARPMNGGGSVIPNSYKKILENETTPCICITDSDKLTPIHDDSPTAKKCMQIAASSTKITYHFSLKERELENIIPFSWYERWSGKPSVARKISRMVMDTDCKKNHFDFKEGICLDWIQNNTSAIQKYWQYSTSNLQKSRKSCRFCKLSKSDCSCSKVDGFGSDILDKFLNHLIKCAELPSEMHSDFRWQLPAQAVLNFTIAPNYHTV